MKYRIYNVAATLILGALSLVSCYSAMPINEAKISKENTSVTKTVIAYYDQAVGTDAIDTFIKKNQIEVLYRYGNIKGYALKLKNDKQRKDLEKVKGVLSVQEDRVMQLQEDISNAESNTHLSPRYQRRDVRRLRH